MAPSAPSVYFVLGTPGSGRRALLQDLIDNGLPADERVAVLVSSNEPTEPADERLAAREKTSFVRWTATEDALLPTEVPADVETLFLVADTQADVVSQLEALKPWLAQHQLELGRIITVVDCQLAEKTPELALWFDACIHFSDVVFLTKRDGVANKWLSAFIRRYEDQFYPCHFIQVKKGGIQNPALVLEPQPRRVSQYFDEQDEIPADLVIETDDEDDEEEDEDAVKPEPYFERNRSGRRVKEVPDVRAYLARQAQ